MYMNMHLSPATSHGPTPADVIAQVKPEGHQGMRDNVPVLVSSFDVFAHHILNVHGPLVQT